MKTVNDINFSGKKALIRVDFNVPLDKKTFAVTDDNRIRATIPTLKKILSDGGSWAGRKKGLRKNILYSTPLLQRRHCWALKFNLHQIAWVRMP